MEFFQYTLWLTKMAMSMLTYFWPITLIVVLGFLIGLFQSIFISGWDKPRRLLALLPLALTLLIFMWGTAMRHPIQSPDTAPAWTTHVVIALLVAQLFVSIWAVWAMKGYRLFALFAVTLGQWVGLCAAFVSTMSVTGDWL